MIDIVTEIDRGFKADAVYTDFSNAFVKVSHKLLTLQIKYLGIHGNLLQWFGSSLANRLQVVNIEGHVSDYYSVRSGIPQDSLSQYLLGI